MIGTLAIAILAAPFVVCTVALVAFFVQHVCQQRTCSACRSKK